MFVVIGCALLLLGLVASGSVCAVRFVRAIAAGKPSAFGLRALLVALGLLAAVSVAAWLRFGLVPAHHVMYVDEPWYLEIAGKISVGDRPELCRATWTGLECEAFPKSQGWPTLLAGAFLIGGRSETTAFTATRLLGILAVLLAAAGARLLGGKTRHVLAAAALGAVFPSHVAWSATAETAVPAATCLLAGLCGSLLFARRGGVCAGLLAISGLGLAAAIRPELLAAAIPTGAVVFLIRRPGWKASLAAGAGLLVAVLAAVPMWSLNREIYGGVFLSPANLSRSLMVLIDSTSFGAADLFLLALGLTGAVAIFLKRSQPWTASVPLAAGVVSLLAVLMFELFQERMMIASLAALLPFTGFSGDLIPARRDGLWSKLPAIATGCLVGCALWLSWPGLDRASRPPETQLLQTRMASMLTGVRLPSDALVLAEHPSVLAMAGELDVMASGRALAAGPGRLIEEVRRRPVFLLRDMYCEPGFEGTQGIAACGRVLAGFELKPFMTIGLHERSYGLYRLVYHALPIPGKRRPLGL
ncbi:MAG TPA: hypothetical protein VM425_12860 [Myxococcota bacterium]|nr:hypothetical protein [Myxococcota bacterium]